MVFGTDLGLPQIVLVLSQSAKPRSCGPCEIHLGPAGSFPGRPDGRDGRDTPGRAQVNFTRARVKFQTGLGRAYTGLRRLGWDENGRREAKIGPKNHPHLCERLLQRPRNGQVPLYNPHLWI